MFYQNGVRGAKAYAFVAFIWAWSRESALPAKESVYIDLSFFIECKNKKRLCLLKAKVYLNRAELTKQAFRFFSLNFYARNFLLDFKFLCGDIELMKKILFVLLLAISALSLMCACTSVEPERKKPTRDRGTRVQTSFGRPADWEGGLPGMPTNNMPRQY